MSAHLPLIAQPHLSNMKIIPETLLPIYLKVIQDAQSAERRVILQEDNDPSHETKGTDHNLTRKFKQKHGIELLKHSAQSLDLNPAEEIWNNPKSRVRRRQ